MSSWIGLSLSNKLGLAGVIQTLCSCIIFFTELISWFMGGHAVAWRLGMWCGVINGAAGAAGLHYRRQRKLWSERICQDGFGKQVSIGGLLLLCLLSMLASLVGWALSSLQVGWAFGLYESMGVYQPKETGARVLGYLKAVADLSLCTILVGASLLLSYAAIRIYRSPIVEPLLQSNKTAERVTLTPMLGLITEMSPYSENSQLVNYSTNCNQNHVDNCNIDSYHQRREHYNFLQQQYMHYQSRKPTFVVPLHHYHKVI